jgi:hypothetical protein
MKRIVRNSLAALAIPLAFAPAAHAGLSFNIVEVPISAAAKSNDPTLNTARSFDVKATVTGSDDWLSGTINASLTSGSIYQNAFGDSQGNAPNSSFLPLAPALEYDTFVAAANGSTTQPPFASATILATNQPNPNFLVDWGDLVTGGDGTWTIARLTLNPSANGTLAGTLQSRDRQNAALPKLDYSFPIENGAVVVAAVPEPGVLPATAGLVGIIALGVRIRRRRLA